MSEQDNPTVFGKILRGEIPAEIVHDDVHCIAFRDIAPQAPQHLLVIPKRHIASLNEAKEEDRTLLGHLLFVAAELARRFGFAESGYRVVVNTGPDAGQEVRHLHLHVLAGRRLGWPPG